MYNTELPNRAELPSSRQLIYSTLIAAAIAGVVLTIAVLPAEYGIDLTGMGKALGLTRMGEIKAANTGAENAAQPDTPAPTAAVALAEAPKQATPTIAESKAPAAAPTARTDETSVTLKPGQAAEIKLDMSKGSKVTYRWEVRGGAVNFDTHGEPPKAPKSFYHGYGKGRQSVGDKGVLVAAFDGQHGWYWRNRSTEDATITLSTQGEYSAIKRVL